MVTAASAHDALAALDRRTRSTSPCSTSACRQVDGYELLEAIRQRPESRQGDIPAAALTAYARAIDRTRSLQAGFQMHLSKPVQPNELAAAVLALTGRPRASSQV